MHLTILTDARFGWIFVLGQIIVIYTIFLLIQKGVETKRKKKGKIDK